VKRSFVVVRSVTASVSQVFKTPNANAEKGRNWEPDTNRVELGLYSLLGELREEGPKGSYREKTEKMRRLLPYFPGVDGNLDLARELVQVDRKDSEVAYWAWIGFTGCRMKML